MALELFNYSPNVRIGESTDTVGFGVYVTEPDRRDHSFAEFAWRTILGGMITFCSLIMIIILGIIVGFSFDLDHFAIGNPETIWYLLSFNLEPATVGATFPVGFELLFILSSLGGIGYASITHFNDMCVKQENALR